MAVQRIVTNIATEDIQRASSFYGDILGMEVAMDQGWIQTYVGSGQARVQISFASEGGSGTELPDLSIEVDNLDEVYEKICAADISVVYGPADEPWGVRRFYVKDPFGRLVNILTHMDAG